MSYIMITPVKNEINYIIPTMQSIIAQSVLPALWVIIDGGSTDGTVGAIKEVADAFPLLMLIEENKEWQGKTTNHFRVSVAVREAYDLACKVCKDFDYVWTIDADQVLDSNVCAGIIERMSGNPSVGAASGSVYSNWNTGRYPRLGVSDPYPNGELPNKRVYRKEALDSIGGFPVTKYAYDTVILARLRMSGWEITSFPQYVIRNLRKDSGIERNPWTSHTQFGKARWYLGYSPLLLAAGCGYLAVYGEVAKSFGVFCGYADSWFRGDEKIPDEKIRNHFGKDRLSETLK